MSERLDVALAREGVTRSQAARLIREGRATVDDRVETRPSFRVPEGARASLSIPEAKDSTLAAQDIPLDILYEDDCLAVVVKPCGMVVHPAAGNPDGTLVNALLYRLDSLSGVGGEKRPGIVHRLDKDTSGVMLVAKTDAAHVALSRQLAARKMEKHYLAVVAGVMKEPEGELSAPIGRSDKDRKKMAITPHGREAVTRWRVLSQLADRALLDVHILTGRTHQIRVHMASLHHPVLGDVIYGTKYAPTAPRVMLHAWTLSFDHPQTGERMTFERLPGWEILETVPEFK